MAHRSAVGSPPHGGVPGPVLDEGPVGSGTGLLFLGVGCTCGAAQQLESERQRLASNSRCLAERGEQLLRKEAQVEEQARSLADGLELLDHEERELAERRLRAETELLRLPVLLGGVERREELLRREELDLERQAQELELQEQEAEEREEAVAREELELLDERGGAEADLEAARARREEQEERSAEAERRLGECEGGREEAERERLLLKGDEALLTEISVQVGAVRQGLAAREAALQAAEAAQEARLADVSTREGQLLPEGAAHSQALAAAEERLLELRARMEESQQQHERLLRRQRQLGSEEVRISGFEGALRRREGGAAFPEPPSRPGQEASELQKKLQRLRGEEGDWAERVRLQQANVERLEAKARLVDARAVLPEQKKGQRIRERWPPVVKVVGDKAA